MNNTITMKSKDKVHILVPVEQIRGKYKLSLETRVGTRLIVENAFAVFVSVGRG